jgi:hypothetical protein
MPSPQPELGETVIKEMKHCTGNETDLLRALRRGEALHEVVPVVLGILDEDPLASAGFFRGDLLRALIDLPSEFWHREQRLFGRYQNAVRAGALARRSLPNAERMRFWTEQS